MNRGPFIFIGVFAILSVSWAFTLNKPQAESGNLSAFDENGVRVVPALSGLADKGRAVYQDLGCISCHTQQVRFSSGMDIERGWGGRQSVARDYVNEDVALVGTQRLGPDLTNVGERGRDSEWLHMHFFDPQLMVPGSNMPPFAFLYDYRKIVGQPSDRALNLPDDYEIEKGEPIADGYEVVPTREADALVAYMLALTLDYDLREAPSPEKVTRK